VGSLRSTIARSVRQRRKQKRLTQSALAEAVGLSTDMISRIERGTISPSIETVEALARALDQHPSVLLGGTPQHPSTKDKRLADLFEVLLAADSVKLAQIERLLKALD
jgi:transcriptional regulator with XRE-family HTH domain